MSQHLNNDAYLNALLLQVHLQGERFARHHVRIVRGAERLLQLLQLLLGEDGAMTALPLRRRPVMVMVMVAHVMVGGRRGGGHSGGSRCIVMVMVLVVAVMREMMTASTGADAQ